MRQVTKYTDAIKASVLSKALAPNAPGVVELAKEFNIPKATIYTWLSNMSNKNKKEAGIQQRPKDCSPVFKLQAVIDTIGKTEQEQSAYCRSKGIYSNHLEEWKQQILESLGASISTTNSTASSKASKIEKQKIQDEVSLLKRDLNRKDKALAELTALLVLKKKADLLWGESEDD
jgi:transposase